MAYASDRGLPRVEVIGHRGSPREARENTLPSFRRAFAAAADGVELDVHATADRVVVVHHDPATNTRPGDAGDVVRIADTPLDGVRGVSVAGERIPTLTEVLAAVPETGVAYVEVKASGIEHEVVETIRAGGRQCAVHSFDHRIAHRVRQLAADIPVGILQTSYPIDPIRLLRDAEARDLWQQWELIDEDLVRHVQRDGRRVIAWTVNDEDVARRMLAWGIDGICTDLPARMRALVDAGN